MKPLGEIMGARHHQCDYNTLLVRPSFQEAAAVLKQCQESHPVSHCLCIQNTRNNTLQWQIFNHKVVLVARGAVLNGISPTPTPSLCPRLGVRLHKLLSDLYFHKTAFFSFVSCPIDEQRRCFFSCSSKTIFLLPMNMDSCGLPSKLWFLFHPRQIIIMLLCYCIMLLCYYVKGWSLLAHRTVDYKCCLQA